MLAEERQSHILQLVNARKSISIAEIQSRLSVSRETVRRDLLALAERRKLRKTHGGALSIDGDEPDIAVRLVTNRDGKQAIGRLAAGMIPDGASVILAGGTTVQAVSAELLPRKDLTVFTNCIASATRLSGRNGNRIHLLGGEIQPRNQACLGRDATQMLSNYYADFAVIGAGAISSQGLLMDFSREESELHGLMIQSAQAAVIVADHTKFGRHAPVRVLGLGKATRLVTDRAPEPAMADLLTSLSVDVRVASPP